MSLGVTKTEESAYNPVFKKILEDIPGGVTIITKEIPSNIYELGAGTLLKESSSTGGLFNPVKIGKPTTGQTANVSIKLKPPILFKVGEFIGKGGTHTASTITSITHTSATTETVVTGTAVGILTTATLVIRNSAAAVTTAARTEKYLADSILRDTVKVRDTDGTTLKNVNAGAVVRGTVDESLLPFYVSSDQKTALTARIRFA